MERGNGNPRNEVEVKRQGSVSRKILVGTRSLYYVFFFFDG